MPVHTFLATPTVGNPKHPLSEKTGQQVYPELVPLPTGHESVRGSDTHRKHSAPLRTILSFPVCRLSYFEITENLRWKWRLSCRGPGLPEPSPQEEAFAGLVWTAASRTTLPSPPLPGPRAEPQGTAGVALRTTDTE